ncbi:HNH endonuclease [Cytobacillus firmus]
MATKTRNKNKKKSSFNEFTRELLINEIINLVNVLEIKELAGWEDVPFTKISSLKENTSILTDELSVLLDELDSIFENRRFNDHSEIGNDQPHVDDQKLSSVTIDKEDHSPATEPFNHEPANFPLQDAWRYKTPKFVRDSIEGWYTYPPADLEEEIRCYIRYKTSGSLRNEIDDFLKILVGLQEKQDDFEDYDTFIHEPAIFPLQDAWRYQTPKIVRESIPGWYTYPPIDLEEEISDYIRYKTSGSLRDEIDDFLGTLVDLRYSENEEAIDILEVIDKYKDGRIKTVDQKEAKIDDSWRSMIPGVVKNTVRNWRKEDIHTIYDQAKALIPTHRNEVIPFISEMSQIIFDQDVNQDEEDEEDVIESIDSVADSIMSLVEMIILPHLEVIDLIQKNGGKITFANVWNKPFNESLKNEVKDRDGWKCVVCESETDLHVHHKIPREKGGIHHPDNLVTLCSSCHGVIETADIKQAFQRCFS